MLHPDIVSWVDGARCPQPALPSFVSALSMAADSCSHRRNHTQTALISAATFVRCLGAAEAVTPDGLLAATNTMKIVGTQPLVVRADLGNWVPKRGPR
jgi:hypothetical protein